MLKILHVASGDLWGGAETMLWYLAREQRQSGCVNVSALLLNEGRLADRLRDAGVPVTIVPEHGRASFRLMTEVGAAVREAAPDIVHTHGRKENVFGAVAARAIRVPSIRTVHGSEEHPPKWWDLRRRAARLADTFVAGRLQSRTVAVSADLASALTAARYRQVHVVLNGIDAPYVAARASRNGGRRPASDPVTIGFVGRLTPIKRVDRFLELAKALCVRRSDVFRFTVAGDGPQMDAARRLTEDLGLDDVVTFLGDVDEPWSMLAALDAVVMTSDNEGIPYVVLECLALGVPVLAFRVGGLPEVLDDGMAGRLVDAGDLDALVDQVLAIADRAPSIERRVLNGARLVREKFSAERMMQAYLQIYRDVAGLGAV